MPLSNYVLLREHRNRHGEYLNVPSGPARIQYIHDGRFLCWHSTLWRKALTMSEAYLLLWGHPYPVRGRGSRTVSAATHVVKEMMLRGRFSPKRAWNDGVRETELDWLFELSESELHQEYEELAPHVLNRINPVRFPIGVVDVATGEEPALWASSSDGE